MPPRKAGHGSAPKRGRRHKAGGHGGEEGGSERWLVTYADMLTLLLVLFIVLFSISIVNTSKFIALRSSLSAAFGDGPKGVLSGGQGLNENAADQQGKDELVPGVPVAPSQAVQGNQADANPTPQQDFTAQAEAEVQDYRKIEKSINAALKAHGLAGAVQFAIDRRGLIITVVTNALVFPGNSAQLLSEGQHILAVIAPPLVHATHNIEVDGNTNQEKVSTYPYPSGWELSSARASAVVRYLISAGVGANRLSAVGYSDQRPLYPPSDPRSITLNRRVDIVVLSSLPAAAGDALEAAASGH